MMKKSRGYWSKVIVTLSIIGISFSGCDFSFPDYPDQKNNLVPIMRTISEKKIYRRQISDEQHKKDLEFIRNYLIVLRDKSQYRNHPIPTTRVVDQDTLEKLQKGKISPERPFKHYLLSYNIDVNAFFITTYVADAKQEIYTSEKRYSDYNFNGLQIGTRDNIEWTFYNPDFKLFVSSNLDFSKDREYRASIDRDIFEFNGDEKYYQRRIEKSIDEYKELVQNIGRIVSEKMKETNSL